jgi:hypothetical protein
MASLAIDAPVKWTDNLVAHHAIPEVRSKSRGVPRGVSWAGLVRIALIRELHLALGCGVREAVALDPRGDRQETTRRDAKYFRQFLGEANGDGDVRREAPGNATSLFFDARQRIAR